MFYITSLIKTLLLNNKPRYINVRGRLLDLAVPRVMGIINVTPDSFYKGSRFNSEREIAEAAGRMISDGADILDIGGYSSRPGAADITTEEEWNRVSAALKIIVKEFPDAILSIDTFRAEIARRAVEEFGAAMINDISGGEGDKGMFALVAGLNVPYVLMHMRGNPRTMQQNTEYDDVVADILRWFAPKIQQLRLAGVKDIILDPGFGFSKTVSQNFEILNRLREFTVAELPVLAGLSRKTTVWKTLGISAAEALNGTTVLNTTALLNGADFLRVHDVKEAVEAVKLVSMLL